MPGDKTYSFPKENRLLKQKDFDKVYQDGQSYRNQNFHFYFLEKGSPPPRLGLAVRKEVGKAAERNKVKRIIREVFRTYRESLRNIDIIIKPSPKMGKLKKKKIKEALLKSLSQFCKRGDSNAEREK
jgi:ribonuclease P protein component